MIGSLISAGIGTAASIFGGIKASQTMNEVKRDLEDRKRENKDWYNRRYNEDATQRADAQRILAQTEDTFRKRNAAAAGTAAIMGGTEESVAATKAENAAALADATSKIAVNAEAQKDNIEQQYRTTDSQLSDKINDMKIGKANAISQAASGVAQASSSLGKVL